MQAVLKRMNQNMRSLAYLFSIVLNIITFFVLGAIAYSDGYFSKFDNLHHLKYMLPILVMVPTTYAIVKFAIKREKPDKAKLTSLFFVVLGIVYLSSSLFYFINFSGTGRFDHAFTIIMTIALSSHIGAILAGFYRQA